MELDITNCVKEELIYENDASASFFGYEFQVDAALYLFCEFYEDAKSFKVESILQDIEIVNKDESKILCQAKAVQNPNGNVNYSNKLHDALVSLGRNRINNCHNYVYITNFDNPLGKTMQMQFNNKIVGYDYLNNEAKDILKNSIDNIKNEIENKINDKYTSDKTKKKLISIRKNIDQFNISEIKIISLTRYFDSKKSETITEKLADLLNNNFNIDSTKASLVSKKIYTLLHQRATLSGILKDDSKHDKYKIITREDFCWPMIVANNMEITADEIEKFLNGEFDEDLRSYIEYSKSDLISKYNYEMINRITSDYSSYKNSKKGLKSDNFIINKWKDYRSEFPSEKEEPVKNKALTIFFLYCILKDLSFTKNVIKGKEL